MTNKDLSTNPYKYDHDSYTESEIFQLNRR